MNQKRGGPKAVSPMPRARRSPSRWRAVPGGSLHLRRSRLDGLSREAQAHQGRFPDATCCATRSCWSRRPTARRPSPSVRSFRWPSSWQRAACDGRSGSRARRQIRQGGSGSAGGMAIGRGQNRTRRKREGGAPVRISRGGAVRHRLSHGRRRRQEGAHLGAFPANSHPPIVYPAAMLVGGRNAAAAAAQYFSLLKSAEALDGLRKHGFVPYERPMMGSHCRRMGGSPAEHQSRAVERRR